MKTALLLAMLLCLSYAIDIEFYYGEGCPHCAATEAMFEKLGDDYELNIASHEVNFNVNERARLFDEYSRFGVSLEEGGIPTTIIDGKAMVIGELDERQWRVIFDACDKGECPEGAFTEKEFDAVVEGDSTAALTWSVIIGAALVDSVNPCTIAVMVLLISAVLYAKGKRDALLSGVLFTITIFTMYMLYGLGIMEAITTLEITRIFYIVVTIGAFLLSVMEVNAYINYKPGFLAVEIPMFIRPYVKKVTKEATSPPAVVVAAILCSLFLLPCSSGPYLMVLGMIAKAATIKTLTYLLVYNLFFVLPMLLITISVYLGKTTIEQVGKTKDRYIRQVHLVSGIILFILFLLMLNQLAGGF